MRRLQDELLEALSTYADALRARDLGAIMACFTSDAVVMSPLTPTATGNGVQDLYRQIVDSSDLDITFTIEDLVIAHDDEAAVFTHSSGRRTSLSVGEVTPVHSREAFVFLRKDDAWRIQRYLFNRIV